MSSYFFLKLLRKKRNEQKIDKRNSIQYKNQIKLTTLKSSNENICRICLKNGDKSIYSEDTNFNIPEAIKSITGIEISEADTNPKYICNSCFSLLQGAITFRDTALTSDQLLQQTTTNDSLCESICNDSENSNDKPVNNKDKNIRIQCNICKSIIRSHSYEKHLMRHQSATHLVCEVCGKLYRKDNLIRHLQLHSDILPYQCQFCPYRGRFYESLKIHLRTHTGDKPFSCEACSLRFLTRSNLNRHLLTHKKEKPFKCLECNRGFYLKRDMETHFKSDHSGIKDYVCDLCGNKYGTKKALMRHELRVHKRDKMAKGRTPLYLLNKYRKSNEDQ